MNVYGKIDEKQEKSHYQDWSVPEKREGAPIPFFSILLWSLVATAISVVIPLIFGLARNKLRIFILVGPCIKMVKCIPIILGRRDCSITCLPIFHKAVF